MEQLCCKYCSLFSFFFPLSMIVFLHHFWILCCAYDAFVCVSRIRKILVLACLLSFVPEFKSVDCMNYVKFLPNEYEIEDERKKKKETYTQKDGKRKLKDNVFGSYISFFDILALVAVGVPLFLPASLKALTILYRTRTFFRPIFFYTFFLFLFFFFFWYFFLSFASILLLFGPISSIFIYPLCYSFWLIRFA